MNDDPRKPVAGDPLDRGEDEGATALDAFGNPVAPDSAASRPVEGPPPAPVPGGAPPASPPPGYGPPTTAPSGSAPPAPPGYAGAPTYPPPSLPAAPGGVGAYGGHVLAEWGARLAASALNFVFRLLLFVPAVAAFIAGSEVAGAILLVLAVVAAFLYAPLFMMRKGKRNGQSPGKQIMGIRVVRLSGEPMGFGWSLLREFVIKGILFDSIGGGILFVPTLLNYLWPLWDEQNRALHDMILGTRVVRA